MPEPHASSVRFWPKSERPRERLSELGPEALSLTELIAILLGTGGRSSNLIAIAHKIASMPLPFNRSILEGIPEIGPVKLARLLAAVELGKRITYVRKDVRRIVSSRDVVEFLSPKLSHLEQEVFVVVSLDIKNRPIVVSEISKGSSEATTFFPKDAFMPVLQSGGSGMICAHNHPSGDPTPSMEDKQLTVRIEAGAKLLGIRFLDHLILTKNQYFSFADQKWNSGKELFLPIEPLK